MLKKFEQKVLRAQHQIMILMLSFLIHLLSLFIFMMKETQCSKKKLILNFDINDNFVIFLFKKSPSIWTYKVLIYKDFYFFLIYKDIIFHYYILIYYLYFILLYLQVLFLISRIFSKETYDIFMTFCYSHFRHKITIKHFFLSSPYVLFSFCYFLQIHKKNIN